MTSCAICGGTARLDDEGTACPNPIHREYTVGNDWLHGTPTFSVCQGERRIVRHFATGDAARAWIRRQP